MFTNRKAWRKWLAQNHNRVKEIWLLYYKKHTGELSITYEHAVEEALCFGWIDGQIRRVDDERFRQRYSPRRDKSVWSENNKAKVRALIKQGKMTAAGMKKVTTAKQNGQWHKDGSTPKRVRTPSDLLSALKANKEAYANYRKLPPAHKFTYIHWIRDAKKTETRKRRIAKVVERTKKNLRPGM